MTRQYSRLGGLLLALWLFAGAGCRPALGVQPSPAARHPGRPRLRSTPLPAGPGASPTAVETAPFQPASPVASPSGAAPTSTPPAETPAAQAQCGQDWCAYPGHFTLQKPIADPAHRWVDPTYRYGSTASGAFQPHFGVEFQASAGSPVLAAAAGRVVAAGEDVQLPFAGQSEEYGNLVVLEHRFPDLDLPVYTLYGHLASVGVQAGQEVKAGDPLGPEGATGIATGPHLHFEVRVGTSPTPRNPELWTAPAPQADGQDSGALAGRISTADGQPLPSANITVQYTGEPGAPARRQIYLESYASADLPGDDQWQENYAAGDLAPGWYRITFVGNGKLYERLAPVFPGQVTVVSEIRETR